MATEIFPGAVVFSSRVRRQFPQRETGTVSPKVGEPNWRRRHQPGNYLRQQSPQVNAARCEEGS